MEYVYYLLVVVSILSLLLLVFVRSESLRNESSRQSARIRTVKSVRGQPQKFKSGDVPPASRPVSPNGQMSQLRTPWGWPGHQGSGNHAVESSSGRSFSSSDHGVASDALHQWVDRLMTEKQTVEDQEYVLRRNASLRALLEDRYGKSDGGRKQLNNGLKTGTEQFGTNLKSDARQLTDEGAQGSSRRTSDLRDIRMPWGW